MGKGGWSTEEKKAILENVKEQCRYEGARDALVNLKKFIREYPKEPCNESTCIHIINEFMSILMGPGV